MSNIPANAPEKDDKPSIQNDCNMATEAVLHDIPNDWNMATKEVPNEIPNDCDMAT
jgi:hypothetical protein